jgi:hypothetical protein
MHDRYLSESMNTKLTPAEAFHWYRSIALFNSKLSGPIQHSERDALWPAALLLGIIAFCYVEVKTPEEAWPLKPASSLDLNWLRMSDGKKPVLKIAQPWRADSIFHAWALEYSKRLAISRAVSQTSSTGAGLEGLPSGFVKLYGLDTTSTTDNNPYQIAASTLAQSLNTDCSTPPLRTFFPLSARCTQTTSDCWSEKIPVHFFSWHTGMRRFANPGIGGYINGRS